MYFRGKPIDEVTWEDIEELKTGEVCEDTFLEYKESLPGNSDSDKKEFLADVTAFANKAGGTIIYGVVEERDDQGKSTGKIGELKGIAESNLDKEIARLQSIIRTGTQPTFSATHFRPIDKDSTVLLLVNIGRGVAGPYLISYQKSGKFYTRTSTGKAQMDVYEIRSSFLESGDWIKQAESFRQQRVHDVWHDDLVPGLCRRPSFFVHMIPMGSNRPQWEIPALSDKIGLVENLLTGEWRETFHVDGVRRTQGRRSASFLQGFRNATLELFLNAPKEVVKIGGNDTDVVDGGALESIILPFLIGCRRFYTDMGITGPFYCCMSAVGCKGHYMFCNRNWIRCMDSDHRSFDREQILISGIAIAATEFDMVDVPRRLFDHLWQAAGWKQSPYASDRLSALVDLVGRCGMLPELITSHPELLAEK